MLTLTHTWKNPPPSISIHFDESVAKETRDLVNGSLRATLRNLSGNFLSVYNDREKTTISFPDRWTDSPERAKNIDVHSINLSDSTSTAFKEVKNEVSPFIQFEKDVKGNIICSFEPPKIEI